MLALYEKHNKRGKNSLCMEMPERGEKKTGISVYRSKERKGKKARKGKGADQKKGQRTPCWVEIPEIQGHGGVKGGGRKIFG